MIYLELLLTFAKIGLFTFGGGYAMLPLIQSEVLAKGWMNMKSLMDFIAVSESTPGPFAINIATYVGAETAGPLGSFCATLGVVLPSFVVILIVARCYEAFKTNRVVKAIMRGLKPVVIALIASAMLSLGKTALFPDKLEITQNTIISFIIFIMMFVLVMKKKHPIFIIMLSGVIGIILGYAGVLR